MRIFDGADTQQRKRQQPWRPGASVYALACSRCNNSCNKINSISTPRCASACGLRNFVRRNNNNTNSLATGRNKTKTTASARLGVLQPAAYAILRDQQKQKQQQQNQLPRHASVCSSLCLRILTQQQKQLLPVRCNNNNNTNKNNMQATVIL